MRNVNTNKLLKIPKKVQETIHIETIDLNSGIFYHGFNIYTKQYYFDDVNFETLEEDDKEKVFKKYSMLINSFATGGEFKITLNNRYIDAEEFASSCLVNEESENEEYNSLSCDLNKIIKNGVRASNGIDTQLILTLRVEAESFAHASEQIDRLEIVARLRLNDISSSLYPLSSSERLKILYPFFHKQEDWAFDISDFDFKKDALLGNSFKDILSPCSISIKKDYVIFTNGHKSNLYGRTLYVKDYASRISDNCLYQSLSIPKASCMSIDVSIEDPKDAYDFALKKLDAVEDKIARWQQSQNKSANFSAEIPYTMANEREEMLQFLKDLNENDQCMCKTTITIFLFANSLEELDSDTDIVIRSSKQAGLTVSSPKYIQIEGFNTAIPIGVNDMLFRRTLTTAGLACQMPFRTQNIMHKGGIYYGVNPLSKKPVTVDRNKLINSNSFILGSAGSGKSFTAKLEILATALKGNSDIVIIDPEREYSPLVAALGGEVVKLSHNSNSYINALELAFDKEEGNKNNIVASKSEFILSLIEKMKGYDLTAEEKGVIDASLRNVYKPYTKFFFGKNDAASPTLMDLREELSKRNDEISETILGYLELFTTGSLNIFSKESNVDLSSRIICFDLYELGSNLKPIAMYVALDFIKNKLITNRSLKKRTGVYIDEAHLLFRDINTSEYLRTLWKICRKYGGYMIGITQNITEMLCSEVACTMLSNSEFLVLLSQSAKDISNLSELLGISDKLLPYIATGTSGIGLLKVGKNIVPFDNTIEESSKVYKIINTKPMEV